MTASSIATHPLVQLVLDTYEILNRESDLSPANAVINDVLSRLVRTVCESHGLKNSSAILNHDQVRSVLPHFHRLLSRAEGLMEKYYAARLSRFDTVSLGELIRFIYWENYVTLVREEMNVLQQVMPDFYGKPIALIGSGPLPLSAILLHIYTKSPVTCLDSDAEAVSLSRQLIGKLDLQDSVRVEKTAGEEADYGSYPIVFVASLVQNKESVLQRILSTRSGVLVAVRSSEGVYQLLYDPVSADAIRRSGLRMLAKTTANQHMINTTLFLTRSV
ncbi:nicotianamine synthase family protein [Lihuaxuella thermophila]|uniref:Nicotianamine synthase protein n=1 Tax=Lihuaxuella thermophila TaxID=1173111 RepID=A0A1H8BHP0_9BACL|nr:nicotianamine synthase family protein [Lihuaxuella thermophila]SEM82391.1 Nicotianamine synthase protein [Lihuaxuella thermophila]